MARSYMGWSPSASPRGVVIRTTISRGREALSLIPRRMPAHSPGRTRPPAPKPPEGQVIVISPWASISEDGSSWARASAGTSRSHARAAATSLTLNRTDWPGFGFCTVTILRPPVRSRSVDHRPMPLAMVTFSTELWVVLTLVSLASVLGVLARIASAVEDEKRLHDAKVTADRLRRQYAAQLEDQQPKEEVIEAEVVE